VEESGGGKNFALCVVRGRGQRRVFDAAIDKLLWPLVIIGKVKKYAQLPVCFDWCRSKRELWWRGCIYYDRLRLRQSGHELPYFMGRATCNLDVMREASFASAAEKMTRICCSLSLRIVHAKLSLIICAMGEHYMYRPG